MTPFYNYFPSDKNLLPNPNNLNLDPRISVNISDLPTTHIKSQGKLPIG